MHVILFVLGLMLSSAGLAVVAYGFREIEFTIGTTLILAGTVVGTGGLLLIGFAATVHQLRRISGIQLPQPMREDISAEPQLPGSAARSVPLPTPAKIPFPARPQVAEIKPVRASDRAPELRVPEPRPVQPELDAAPDPIFGDMLGQAADEFPPEPRVEAPRMETPRVDLPRIEPRIEPARSESARGEAARIEARVPQAAPPVAPPVVPTSRPIEPPMVDEADDVPLSPSAPPKVQLRHQPAPPLTRARTAELRANSNGNPSNGAPATTATPHEAGAEEGAPANGEQPAINFDSLWPAADKRPAPRMARDSARATAATAPGAPFVERRGEAARREAVRPDPTRRTDDPIPPQGDEAPPRAEEPRSESVRAPTGRAEPPVLRTEPAPRVEPAPYRAEPYVPGKEPPALRIESEQPQAAPAPAKSGEAPRAVAILKSGVVDGMAYTLYADGSIEAQLPAGTLRFGSIAELREHIEKNS